MVGHPEDWMIVADKLKDLKKHRVIYDYHVVMGQSTDEVSEKVVSLSKGGYELQGGIFSYNEDREGIQGEWFYQAMVKYED